MIVVFQKRASLWGALIKWWTAGPYCHCELMWGDGTLFSSASPGGTRFLPHATITDDLWDAFWLPSAPGVSAAVKASCAEELNCGYDWLGLWMAQVFGISRQSSTKWFCSEVCTDRLMQHGLAPQRKPHFVSPNGLAAMLEVLGARRLTIADARAAELKQES